MVLWGAFVRATGSGAGCGNHWPLCNGQVTPHSPGIATIIEFTHRATTGIDLALIAGLVVWAFRVFPRNHPVRLGATLSGVVLIVEALIGASLVLLERVAKNASLYWNSAHLLNTLTLLACLTLTAWWALGNTGIRVRGRAGWMAIVSVTAVGILGVTGVIAALGDTLSPVQSLAAGFAQDMDPAANLFVRLRGLHPIVAVCTAAWLIFFAISSARKLSWVLVAAVAAQILAGVVNLLLLAPVWMQLVHLLLADLLWITLVLLCASTLAAPRQLE